MNINRTSQISGLYKSNMPKNIHTKDTSKKNKLEKKDVLEISEEARLFQIAYQAAENSPDIREEKVANIKRQIDEGTYNVSSKDVAEKIMSNYFDVEI